MENSNGFEKSSVSETIPCFQNVLFTEKQYALPGLTTEKHKERDKSKSKLKADIYQFTQETTFHGIRFIFAKGSVLRRLIWIVAVLGCTGAVTWQCVDRLQYFLHWPITTNVKINYNETLIFPTVTICNQNSFKATEAAAIGQYRLIEKLYGGYDVETKLRALRDHNATSTPLDAFFTPAAHRKTDMIVECKWAGGSCGPENFTSYITDYGVCFTFNGPSNSTPSTRLKLTSTGAVHGLRLTLNVEQYEYMPGPHFGAGIKVFLHDQHIPPLVRDLGQAVSTGSHTFMGIKILRLDNLGAPYGECGERQLQYYNHYSKTACWLECLSKHMDKLCQCRLPYVPFNEDSPPVCTLQQQIQCADRAYDDFPAVAYRCECPVSCSYLMYDPQISQAGLSNFLIDKFQRSSWSRKLNSHFREAMEISHRYREDLLAETKELVKITESAYNELNLALLVTMRSLLVKLSTFFDNLLAEMRKRYDRKDVLYGFQEYVLRKNFMRARDAIEERTMGHVVGNFIEFVVKIQTRIEMIANRENDTIRNTIHIMTENMLEEKLRIAIMAKANYSELSHAYATGTQRFRYRYGTRSFEEGQAAVPQILVKSAYNFSRDVQIFGNTGRTLDELISELQEYKHWSRLAFEERVYNKQNLSVLAEKFMDSSKAYLLSKFHWHESLDWPYKQIVKRRAAFRQVGSEFTLVINKMKNNVLNLNSSLELIETSVLSYFAGIIEKAILYTEGGNVTKLELSRIFNGAEIHDGINSLKVFAAAIRTRQQEISDDWPSLSRTVISLWEFILKDRDSVDYYKYRNMTDFLQDFNNVSDKIIQEFQSISKKTRYLFVQNGDRIFYKKLYDIMGALSDFEQGTKVNPTFFRENILKLDIFYRELSYEHIMQNTAYDEFGLICDIGGAFGLFVGASLLSLLEIVDFIGTHITKRANRTLR